MQANEFIPKWISEKYPHEDSGFLSKIRIWKEEDHVLRINFLIPPLECIQRILDTVILPCASRVADQLGRKERACGLGCFLKSGQGTSLWDCPQV